MAILLDTRPERRRELAALMQMLAVAPSRLSGQSGRGVPMEGRVVALEEER